jgi:hypothetical protein
MASSKPVLAGWILWLAGALAGLPVAAAGQDFRVDTELFENQEKEPFLATLTIFANGVVYDFRETEPRETTVFDPRHGQFTLLDESRQVKAIVTTQELLDFTLALETHAAQEKDRLFAFCAAPQFETTDRPIERNGQSLTEVKLAGESLTYVAEGQQPPRAEAIRAYRHFADWCARLNATRPGGLPPGARLALNQALAERELIPLEVMRTTLGVRNKKLELKSQHRFNWTLSGKDRKKIEHAGDMMATYQAVGYDDYRNPLSKDAAARQARK